MINLKSVPSDYDNNGQSERRHKRQERMPNLKYLSGAHQANPVPRNKWIIRDKSSPASVIVRNRPGKIINPQIFVRSGAWTFSFSFYWLSFSISGSGDGHFNFRFDATPRSGARLQFLYPVPTVSICRSGAELFKFNLIFSIR